MNYMVKQAWDHQSFRATMEEERLVPVIYMSATLIYSKYKLIQTKIVIVKELTGKYVYHDSIENLETAALNISELYLVGNQTFILKNSHQLDSITTGSWDIDDRTKAIIFTSVKGQFLCRGYERVAAEKRSIFLIVADRRYCS